MEIRIIKVQDQPEWGPYCSVSLQILEPWFSALLTEYKAGTDEQEIVELLSVRGFRETVNAITDVRQRAIAGEAFKAIVGLYYKTAQEFNNQVTAE